MFCSDSTSILILSIFYIKNLILQGFTWVFSKFGSKKYKNYTQKSIFEKGLKI